MEGSSDQVPPRSSGHDQRYGDPDEPIAWDADDPRRQHDQFAPPAEPCECWCLHCRRTFMSTEIWLQRVVNAKNDFDGFWMCPTPNCGGAGFTFDIFPTDPNHPANAGWHDDDGDEFDEDAEAEEFDFDDDPDDPFDSPDAAWDPAETKYRALDEEFDAAQDDDIEGEEWKYGLAPGERPEPRWSDEARREWEAEQKRYDAPDERPRVVDWSDREDFHPSSEEDDIPF